MVGWANLHWWVAFATSNIFGAISPAKDWVKHWFPVLWPNDKAKPNPDLEAELGPLRTDPDSERLQQMLTVAQDLNPVLLQRATALREWQKDLEAREEAIRGLREESRLREPQSCDCHETRLDHLVFEVEGMLQNLGDGH